MVGNSDRMEISLICILYLLGVYLHSKNEWKIRHGIYIFKILT